MLRAADLTVTIRAALRAAQERLRPVSESAALDAHVLLAETLGKSRAYLLTHDDETLSFEQERQLNAWVSRRAAGEPVAYITGRRAFYDREIIVTPEVLIPRPETELLLEQTLAIVGANGGSPQPTVVDVGTGSGALAVTLAAHCPQARVYATDSSAAALAVAQRNTEANSVTVTFMQGDLLQPLIDGGIRVDLIMANLPYIAQDELAGLAVSRFEPRLALDGGADGLDLIRRLLAQAPQVCNAGAVILLEIGVRQGVAVRELAQALSPQSVDVLPDYAGYDRMVKIVL